MKTSRQIQSEETRQQIFEAYLDLIREKPDSEIKIAELCDRAGVSVGTYYYYYKTKDKLIRQVYYHVDSRFDQIYRRLTADTYMARIVEYILHTSDEAKNYYGLRATTTIYQLQMEIDGSFFTDTSRPFSQHLCELLNGAIQAGELPEGLDIHEAVLNLLCIFRGTVYSWCLLKGSLDMEETIRSTVTAYLRRLSRREAPPRSGWA